jgi:hypothetical protein
MTADKLTTEAAQKLAKLGAQKGGRARANVLTPGERSDIARKAVQARWAKARAAMDSKIDTWRAVGPDQLVLIEQEIKPPMALFSGKLQIAARLLACHVLDNGKRVIREDDIVRALTGRFEGNLERFIETNDLTRFAGRLGVPDRRVDFLIRARNASGRKERISRRGAAALAPFTSRRSTEKAPTGIPENLITAIGYEATLLPDICEAFLLASDQGALTSNQSSAAKQAELIVRACARGGIVNLVDEATGFGAFRRKHEHKIRLQVVIAKDLQKWAGVFPQEFWYELARLEEVHYTARSRPLRWAQYVMMFGSDALEEELRKKSDPGDLHVSSEEIRAHVMSAARIMKQCKDIAEFRKKFDYVFNKSPLQAEIGLEQLLHHADVIAGQL